MTYSASSGEKILALDVDGTVHCNPNSCADDGLTECGITCDKTGQSGRKCPVDGKDGDGAPAGPVFCGCGQVCACGDGSATVYVAGRRRGEFREETVQETIPLCVTPGDASPPGGTVVATEIGGTLYCNPNICANRAREALNFDSRCDDTGEGGGPCGNGFLRQSDSA